MESEGINPKRKASISTQRTIGRHQEVVSPLGLNASPRCEAPSLVGRARGLGRNRAAIRLGGMLLYWSSIPVCLRASLRESMQLVRIGAISVHTRDPTSPWLTIG
jgi:hypothetical protein